MLTLASITVLRVSVPKISEDQKKKGLRDSPQIGVDFRQYYGNLSQKEGFGLDLFICQIMPSKPFHEEISRAKRPREPHETASRKTICLKTTGWAQWCRNPGGVGGIYPPNNLAVSPQ